MGKLRASLLGIVFQLFLTSLGFATDEVRNVQTELRKRHLFHGDSTGEITPALTAAIRHYQDIKGFAPTGVIDWETAASLGIAGLAYPATTPFVLDNKGNVRGANGEALQGLLPAVWVPDKRPAESDYAAVDPNPPATALIRAETTNTLRHGVATKRPPTGRLHPNRPRKETNPFLQAFGTIDHARRFLFGDSDSKKKRRTGKRL
jgi:hypothetical protein